MGFIRTLFALIILAVIIVGGYWLYASYVSAPNAPYWAEINRNLPRWASDFSCQKVRERQPTGDVPSCN